MTSRGARTARGALAAVLAVFVSALFHDAAGGGAPHALALIVALAFAVPACVLLAGRRSSMWRLTLSVALSQAVFHALFSLGGGAATTRFTMPAGHLHMGEHVGVVTTDAASASAGAMGAMAMLPSPLMWVGHALAAVVTIVAIRRGERTLRALLTLAALRIVRIARLLTAAPVPFGRPRATLAGADAARPLRSVADRFRSLQHRGPPVACAF